MTKGIQLLESDGRYVLVTTTVADGVKNVSYEIVPNTDEAFSSAWDRVWGFGSKKSDDDETE